MHDLFVSYAREDAAWVERFCGMLQSEGFDVWRDSAIPTGKTFGRVIEAALADARAVIVVWSRYAVESDWVRAEATEGLARGILFPVCRDKSAPPLRFRTLQTADLSAWRFEPEDPLFRRVVEEIRTLVQVGAAVNPVAENRLEAPPASVFGVPWRYAKEITGVVLVAIVALVLWFWNGSEQRHQRSLELSAEAAVVRDRVEADYRDSGNYWGVFLEKKGGQPRVELSLLLALEAFATEPSPAAAEALRKGLVLLPRPVLEFGQPAAVGSSADISQDGTRVAWSDRRSIRIIDTLHSENSRIIEHEGRLAAVRLLGKGDYLAAIGTGGRLEIWNLVASKPLVTVAGNGENTIAYAVNATDTRVAVRQADLVTVREVSDGRLVAKIALDRFVDLSAQQSLDLSPDGRLLAVALKDQLVVWDLNKEEERLRLSLADRVSALSFDPPGDRLIAFIGNGEALLIDPVDGDARTFPAVGAGQLIRFSSDGGLAAFASSGVVRVVRPGQPDRPLLEYAHADNIKDIRFSDDGLSIASAGQDGMVRVWQIATARELTRFAYSDQVLAIRFSHDGERLTALSRSGEAAVWPLFYADPAVEACRVLRRTLTPEEWRRYLPDERYRKRCPPSPP
ncbi:MAG: TIR domain-containing protein [Gammaproteobacteria bacterium]|nr:TIR domain-containing protein [Gammaproteobacteria bacterium]